MSKEDSFLDKLNSLRWCLVWFWGRERRGCQRDVKQIQGWNWGHCWRDWVKSENSKYPKLPKLLQSRIQHHISHWLDGYLNFYPTIQLLRTFGIHTIFPIIFWVVSQQQIHVICSHDIMENCENIFTWWKRKRNIYWRLSSFDVSEKSSLTIYGVYLFSNIPDEKMYHYQYCFQRIVLSDISSNIKIKNEPCEYCFERVSCPKS